MLNIPTKINKGTVKIITLVELIKKGDKVGSSKAALLAKLGKRPSLMASLYFQFMMKGLSLALKSLILRMNKHR